MKSSHRQQHPGLQRHTAVTAKRAPSVALTELSSLYLLQASQQARRRAPACSLSNRSALSYGVCRGGRLQAGTGKSYLEGKAESDTTVP